MMNIIRKLISHFFTWYSLKGIQHGQGCHCNFKCKFTKKSIIGDNCHFNGMRVSGNGMVKIGNNFHSGKNIRVITTFHNFDRGSALPYDDTSYSKNVNIEDNVWLGESVIILGGVTIGEGAVIQAGSVVCVDVPPLAIAGGHPAVPFKYRDSEHYWLLKNNNKFM